MNDTTEIDQVERKKAYKRAYMKKKYETKEGRAVQNLKYYKRKFAEDSVVCTILDDPELDVVTKLFRIKEYNFLSKCQ